MGTGLAIKLKNYKKDDGVRLLTIECALEHVGQIRIAATYIQKSGLIKKVVGRQAFLTCTPPGRATVAEPIKRQSNLVQHVSYSNKMYYIGLEGIVCLKKRVEARRLDGQPHSPKFVTG